MSKLYIQKKSVSELPKATGSISDTLNVEDKVTNAPSINLVTKLSGIPEEGIIAYEGDDIPEGYEETTNPITALADLFFPIGRGFLDFTDTDYSNWLGLTWERTLLGVSPVGYNPDDADFNQVGKTGGEKTHTMTEAEMFPHKHNVTGSWFCDLGQQGKWGSPVYQVASDTWTAGGTNITSSMRNTGGGQPMNNMHPYQVVSYWKRVAPKTKISFSIYTREYQAEEGMTFYEWVNSEYNTDNWQVNSNNYVINNILSSGKTLYVNQPNGGGAYLLSSETIIADYVYSQYAEK